jgi:methionyl-tRNA formyltransferase
MEKLKVVFIGGFANGLVAYNYLKANKYVDIPLAITYSDDFHNQRDVHFPNGDNILKTGQSKTEIDLIQSFHPDLILVAGWSELLPTELLEIPKLGVIGFHPSKLPFDRGRSVVAWQLEEGYREGALTMFYYNQIPDGGDIIAQELFNIEENDYLNDVLQKITKSTYNLLRAYFPLVRLGINPRKPQSINEGTFRRLRTEKDSVIDWNRNSREIYNKIRAISHPYPGAIAYIENEKYKVLEAEIINFNFGVDCKSGTKVAALFDSSIVIKCKDGFLRLLTFEKIPS